MKRRTPVLSTKKAVSTKLKIKPLVVSQKKHRKKIKVVFVCFEGLFGSDVSLKTFANLLRSKRLFSKFSLSQTGTDLPEFEAKLRSADFIVPVNQQCIAACQKQKKKRQHVIYLKRKGFCELSECEPVLAEIREKEGI